MLRAVIDRLNVLAPGRWRAAYELIDQRPGAVEGGEPALVYECRLTVFEETYPDVGAGPDHKAARSDALKRAAVHIGIGHCLYRIGRVRMRPGPRRHQSARAARLVRARRREPALAARALRRLARRARASPSTGCRSPTAAPLAASPRSCSRRPARRARRQPPAPHRRARRRAGRAAGARRCPAARRRAAAHRAGADAGCRRQRAARAGPGGGPGRRERPAGAARGAGGHRPPPRDTPATLDHLVRCVHATTLDALNERRLHDLRGYLDAAAGGRVTDAELAARIAELEQAPPGDQPAGERLAAWLLAREEAAAA